MPLIHVKSMPHLLAMLYLQISTVATSLQALLVFQPILTMSFAVLDAAIATQVFNLQHQVLL